MAAGPASVSKGFEMNTVVSTQDDVLFKYDAEQHKAQAKTKPWKQDVHYFKKVKMSSQALIKIVMHANSGGDLEVMGMLQGYINGDTMFVMDSFALPVEGSETRVNAASEAMEYMVAYLKSMESVGRKENCIGWYHSHPGYGCWLSGIDVGTQAQNQMFQEPWLAVVVDPKRTMAGGKVEIGAFRTYPETYTPPDDFGQQQMSIPKGKVEEFGLHFKKYYQLPIEFFKSSVDTQLINLLWNKSWVNSLTASPLVANREYTTGTIIDVVDKLKGAEEGVMHSGRSMFSGGAGKKKEEESVLSKINKECAKITSETLFGVMNQVIKDVLFNPARQQLRPRA
eukprot:TRINITY_DN3733_c0_g1_i1.p1 TRINITY_DN3733_c0_g1~~TRINITY_DN3733_c0_g1_i1.p1  ORF type:complete len:339 (+),score=78.66 TRINITY_DN3733_c0_g1_i1:64-1080(+)